MREVSTTALVAGAKPIDLIVSPEPFSPRVERLEACEGQTIAQLLTGACQIGALDPQDLACVEVFVDGQRLVDRQAALDVRPRAGVIVNVVVLPQGGGGGGNKVLTTLLEVALIAATAWVAGPAAGLIGPAGAWTAGLGIRVAQIGAAIAIGVAGSALIQAINKPSKPTTTYDLEGQSNQSRKGQSMPLCMGQRRVAFDLASSAFSTFQGDDTFVTAIYAAHYGPCQVTAIKIGETLLSAYPSDEYQVEYFLTPGPRNSTLYPTDIHQDSFQNTLDRNYGTTVTETTVLNALSAELDFYWAGGLYYPKSDGRTETSDTKIYVEISPYGANTWQPAPGLGAGTDKSGNAYPAGTYYVQASSKTPVRQTLKITLPTQGQWDIRLHRDTRPEDDTNNDAVTWTALRTPLPGKPVLDETLAIIVLKAKASQDFSGTLGVVSGIVTPIVPIWNGTDWNTAAPSSNPAALDRWMYTGPAAAYPLTADEIDASYAEQYALIEAQGWDSSVLVADQESQQDVSKKLGSAGRFLSYWNGSRLVAVPEWTKDAPRQMFAGRNASGFRRTRTYPDPLHAVYVTFVNADEDWKDDGLYVYADGYSATNTTLVETLQLDFSCGAQRAFKEGRNVLARRKDQVFTYDWTAGIDALVSTLGDRVRARRTSALYDQADARVTSRIWAGAAGSGAVAGLRLDIAFEMTAGQSYALDCRTAGSAIFGVDLAVQAGLQRTVMFATPLAMAEAPVKGDLVAIGRVSQVTEDVEITDIDPQSDRTVTIKARNYIGDSLVAAETGTIPALTSFLTARTPAPVPRILSAAGSPSGVQVGYEVAQQRQAGIRGFTARWRYTPASGEVSTWNTLPMLGATERLVQTPPIEDAQHVAGDSDGEVRVDVEVRTVMTTGEISDPAAANAILVIQGVLPVTGFSVLGATRTAPDGSSYPVLAVSADAVLSGAVQELVVELQPAASSPAAWVSAGHTLAATNPVGDYTGVAGGKVYDVRGRWRDANGWVGDWVEAVAVAVPGGALVSVSTTHVPGGATVGSAGTTADQLISDVEAAVSSAGGASGSASSALAQIEAEISAREAGDSTLQTQVTSNAAAIGSVSAAVTSETDTRISADTALGARIDTVSAAAGAAAAAVTTEQTARAGADTALGVRIDTVTASAAGAAAAVTTEAGVRASADGALGVRIDTLTATVGGVSGSVTTEQTARAAADTALGARVDTVSATIQSQPNLLVNPSFAQGAQGWALGAGAYTSASAGSGATDPDAPYVAIVPAASGNGSEVFIANQTGPATAGQAYSLQSRLYSAAIGDAQTAVGVECVFLNSSAAEVGRFGVYRFDTGGWDEKVYTATNQVAPAGTATFLVRLKLTTTDGSGVVGSGGAAGGSRVKLEKGPVCTSFSDENLAAQVQVTSTAVASVEAGQAAEWKLGVTAGAATGEVVVAALEKRNPDGSVTSSSAVRVKASTFLVESDSGAELSFGDAPGEPGLLTVPALRVQQLNIGDGQVDTGQLAAASVTNGTHVSSTTAISVPAGTWTNVGSAASFTSQGGDLRYDALFGVQINNNMDDGSVATLYYRVVRDFVAVVPQQALTQVSSITNEAIFDNSTGAASTRYSNINRHSLYVPITTIDYDVGVAGGSHFAVPQVYCDIACSVTFSKFNVLELKR